MTDRSGSVCAIYNPASGSADDSAAFEKQCGDLCGDLCRTEQIGDAADKAADAAKRGCDVVVVAGGDGTVSTVVTGLMRARDAGVEHMPALLITPLGTGNDLARTLGLPLDPGEALKLLDGPSRRLPLDVMRWKLHSGGQVQSGYAVNVLAGGFSSKLQKSLTPEIKKRWGPFAYARAALAAARELEPHELHLRIDDGDVIETTVLNAVVANARYAGGGILLADDADPHDGTLDVILTAPGSALDVAALSARILAGEVDESDMTEHHRGRKVEVWARPDLPFNVDGDWVGTGRLEVEVVPSALRVVVPTEAATKAWREEEAAFWQNLP